MSPASTNNNETSSATRRCKIDVTHPISVKCSSSSIRHEPMLRDADNPIATPVPPPVVVAGQETGDTKGEEEECGASKPEFGGLFPCAGRPLPGEVVECLFSWLRSSDLSALYSSSSAAAFPGKIGRLGCGRTVQCTSSVLCCPGLYTRNIHTRVRGTHADTDVCVGDTLVKTCSTVVQAVQVQNVPFFRSLAFQRFFSFRRIRVRRRNHDECWLCPRCMIRHQARTGKSRNYSLQRLREGRGECRRFYL